MIPKFDPPARQSRPKKRKLYWSVMLVGEHGRVIPFKYFKEVVLGALALLILAVAALALVSFGYVRQSRQVAQLQADINEVREQAVQLRDEKDMLLAQLVISQKATAQGSAAEPAAAPPATPPREPDKPSAASPEKALPAVAAKEQAVDPAPARMTARITQFGVIYEPAPALLTVRFRLQNTTPGRTPLAGSIAVVLGNQNDAAVKKVLMPGAILLEGGVSPEKGEVFTVNNYRTMEFKMPTPPAPPEFNIAEVFVFTPEGAEIIKQNFRFEIEQKAPAPKSAKKGAPESVNPPAAHPQISGAAAPVLPASPSPEPGAAPPAADAPAVDAAPPAGAVSNELREKY